MVSNLPPSSREAPSGKPANARAFAWLAVGTVSLGFSVVNGSFAAINRNSAPSRPILAQFLPPFEALIAQFRIHRSRADKPAHQRNILHTHRYKSDSKGNRLTRAK